MPECGIEGRAEVLGVEACPAIEPGSGPVVTATFRHRAATVVDLHLTGVERPIGCTGNHPFWSEDRREFVRADSLRPGERLLALSGPTTVSRIVPRPTPEPVYNLEVAGEHVYHVAATGVLVHNGTDCTANITRGVVDEGNVKHYLWKSPSGKVFDLMLDAEVQGRKLVVREGHIMPNAGTFGESTNTLGPEGLKQLLRDLGHTFDVDAIELLHRVKRQTGKIRGFGPGIFSIPKNL